MSCPAKREGFSCTRPRTHQGDHMARGIGGIVLRRWKRTAQITKTKEVRA